MDPMSAFTAVGSTLSAIVTAANIISALKNTPEDVRACLALVEQVNDDLQSLVSARNKHLDYLSRNPEDLNRIDKIVLRATQALLQIGRKLEGCRQDANGGKTPVMGRVMWVISDSASFLKHSAGLAVLQAGIIAERTGLSQISLEKRIEERLVSSTANYETTYENEELFYMNGGKKRTTRELNLLDLDDMPPSYPNVLQQTWSRTLVPDGPAYCQDIPIMTTSSSTDFKAFSNPLEPEWQQYLVQSTNCPRTFSPSPSVCHIEDPRPADTQQSLGQLNPRPSLSPRASFSQSTYSFSTSPCLTPSQSTFSKPYPASCIELPAPEIYPAVPPRPRSVHSIYSAGFPSPSPPSKSHPIKTSEASLIYPPIPSKFPIVQAPAICIRQLPSPSCLSDSLPSPCGENELIAIHAKREAEEEDLEDAFFTSLKMDEVDRRRRSRSRMVG